MVHQGELGPRICFFTVVLLWGKLDATCGSGARGGNLNLKGRPGRGWLGSVAVNFKVQGEGGRRVVNEPESDSEWEWEEAHWQGPGRARRRVGLVITGSHGELGSESARARVTRTASAAATHLERRSHGH
eukprot:3366953-Rhodomonas_salina.1